MKAKMLIAATAFALLVSPGFAQTQSEQSNTQAQKPAAAQQVPSTTGAGPSVRGPNDVYDNCTGKYLGSDPDPNIRVQILREGDMGCKGAGD